MDFEFTCAGKFTGNICTKLNTIRPRARSQPTDVIADIANPHPWTGTSRYQLISGVCSVINFHFRDKRLQTTNKRQKRGPMHGRESGNIAPAASVRDFELVYAVYIWPGRAHIVFYLLLWH